MKFEVVEIRDNGVTITHYLKGKRSDVKKDIEMFKQNAKRYEKVGKNGMVMWV
jgi:peptide subunit release factor 1 (eRF1)